MAHTERREPDLFAGVLELSLADASAAQGPPRTKLPHDELDEKAEGAFKTISETAKMLALPQHVLRFWESKFTQIKPLKLKGGRRYYRPQDIEVLLAIKHLLYKQGYTIKGARKAFSQFKRQKDQPMAKSTPPKKPRKQPLLELDDTPLFSLMGESAHAPQSMLVQAAMRSNSAAVAQTRDGSNSAAVAQTKDRSSGDLSGEARRAQTEAIAQTTARPAAESPKAPHKAMRAEGDLFGGAPQAKGETAAKSAPVAEAKPVASAQKDARKEELKNIHSELLELREMIKNLPPLTAPV